MAASLVRVAGTRVVGPLARREMSYAVYADRLDYPAPQRRFVLESDMSGESKALKEKEKGDWSALTKEEKVALYRLSFQKTYAEMNTPSGEWKSVLGYTLIGLGVSMGLYGLQKKFVAPPTPRSLTKEWQEAQLRYNIAIRNNPITGISSKWDYEKNDWKK